MEQHKKGIVMKVTEEHIVVLFPDQTFQNITRPSGDIPALGARIAIPAEKPIAAKSQQSDKQLSTNHSKKNVIPRVLRWGSLVALILLSFSIYLFWPAQNEGAYVVQLQINPHFAMHIDEQQQVKHIQAMNNQARELLPDLDWRNQHLRQVTLNIISLSHALGIFGPDHTGVIHTWIEPSDPLLQEVDDIQALLSMQMHNYVREALDTTNVQSNIFVQDPNRPISDHIQEEGLQENSLEPEEQNQQNDNQPNQNGEEQSESSPEVPERPDQGPPERPERPERSERPDAPSPPTERPELPQQNPNNANEERSPQGERSNQSKPTFSR